MRAAQLAVVGLWTVALLAEVLLGRLRVPALMLFVGTWGALAYLLQRGAGRRQRARDGCCAESGYCLRGSRGRCPECGKLIPPGTRR